MAWNRQVGTAVALCKIHANPPRGGGGIIPPRFFEIILLDFCEIWAGGGYSQSLKPQILKHYNP